MKKRRFLGHVSSILQLKAEATKALDKALEEGHIHGSQQNSGSVFITEAGSALLVNGTDVNGASRTFRLGITGSVVQFVPTGSV